MNCPQCKNFIDPSSNVCPFCGFNFRMQSSSGKVTPPYQDPYQASSQYQDPTYQPTPHNPPPYQSTSPYQSPSSYQRTSNYQMPVDQSKSFVSSPTGIASIAGIFLGVINLCSWIIPLCGCPLSLLGAGLSVFGVTSQEKRERTLALVGIILNAFTFVLSIINSIFGILIYSGSN